LPELCLEAVPDCKPGPRAIVESQERTQLIVCADEAAHRAGVHPGMSAAAALALVPQLRTQERDPHRERSLLGALAQLSQRLTPRVSLAPPDAVLLEVRGSLRLFGGPEQLRQVLLDACVAAGVRPRLALAPTPLAALAGARAGGVFEVLDGARLVGALAPLPHTVLRWPREVLERLAKVGVRSIGEALRLPRAGFARRFGLEQLAALDHLVGRSADLRRLFKAPERFHARRACPYELEGHEAVLAMLTSLLERLAEFLEARQCGITELDCRLEHRRAPPTRWVLKLAAPQADANHFAALLSEQLAALALPEPVRACEVRSGRLEPRSLQAQSLWQPGEYGGGAGAQSPALIERLRARLGASAVHGLAFGGGHRPEALSCKEELEADSAREVPPASVPWAAFRRPLWLLSVPQQLAQQQGLPRHRGPLRLLGEPERIETDWWGRGEIARDYYRAVDPGGSHLWIFRERTTPHRWFLHGIFG
jgi:protein ImuB